MLNAFEELKTYRVISPRGEIGRVADIVFPRGQWCVRYLIAWSDELNREVVLPASRVRPSARQTHALRVEVNPDQIETSPRWDLTRRIEDREEQELYEHYGWPPYWLEEEQDVAPIGALFGESERVEEEPDEPGRERPEMQLVSGLVGAFAVHARETEFGVLQDIVLDDRTWLIHYLVVDSPSQTGSKLVGTDYVGRLDWVENEVYLSLPASTLAEGPVYTSPQRMTPELDRALHDYYERIGTTG